MAQTPAVPQRTRPYQTVRVGIISWDFSGGRWDVPQLRVEVAGLQWLFESQYDFPIDRLWINAQGPQGSLLRQIHEFCQQDMEEPRLVILFYGGRGAGPSPDSLWTA